MAQIVLATIRITDPLGGLRVDPLHLGLLVSVQLVYPGHLRLEDRRWRDTGYSVSFDGDMVYLWRK